MDEIGRLIGRLIGCLIMTVLVLLCVAAVLWCMQLVVGLVACVRARGWRGSSATPRPC